MSSVVLVHEHKTKSVQELNDKLLAIFDDVTAQADRHDDNIYEELLLAARRYDIWTLNLGPFRTPGKALQDRLKHDSAVQDEIKQTLIGIGGSLRTLHSARRSMLKLPNYTGDPVLPYDIPFDDSDANMEPEWAMTQMNGRLTKLIEITERFNDATAPEAPVDLSNYAGRNLAFTDLLSPAEKEIIESEHPIGLAIHDIRRHEDPVNPIGETQPSLVTRFQTADAIRKNEFAIWLRSHAGKEQPDIHSWHYVVRELKPYICTFVGCKGEPGLRFRTFSEWKQHEQRHYTSSRPPVCPLCAVRAVSFDHIAGHLELLACVPFKP